MARPHPQEGPGVWNHHLDFAEIPPSQVTDNRKINSQERDQSKDKNAERPQKGPPVPSPKFFQEIPGGLKAEGEPKKQTAPENEKPSGIKAAIKLNVPQNGRRHQEAEGFPFRELFVFLHPFHN